ncbi:MAG TPA: SDR family NAD(P)-dependent oxidoreductase [Bacteriovoracaceae bacterium]|nr:SDR family NAD(P)-dependent oxidoreductase [Bacteriovoracaceae bacterium]
MKKLALITGGTSGLGYACATKLAQHYDLALAYGSNEEKAILAKSQIQANFPECRVELFKGELNGHKTAQELYSRVGEQFTNSPAILINSAGRLRDGLFLNMDFSVQEEMVQEHLLTTMALSYLCLKNMYKEKFGRIINFSSVSANYFKKGQVGYACVKSGIEGFTKCLAMEVAHRGITINALAPGLIETPMTQKMVDELREEKSLRKKIPIGRAGRPEEVGELALFLCSENASYITGSVITIDGGRSLGDNSV